MLKLEAEWNTKLPPLKLRRNGFVSPQKRSKLKVLHRVFAGDNLSDGPNRATRRADAKKLQRTLRPIKIAGARMREKERLDAARLHNHLKPGLDA